LSEANTQQRNIMLNTSSVIDRILSSENYYVILGIGRDATQAQIRQQYLKASLKVPKATKAFLKLKEAYDQLSDILTRKQYETTNPQESSHPDDFQQGEEAARQHEEEQKKKQQQEQKKSPEDYPRRKQEDQQSQQQEQQRRRQEEQQRKQRQEEQRRQQEEWQRRREEQERRRQQQDAERRQQEERRRRQEEQQKREEEQRMWDQILREEQCRQQEERQRQYSERQRTFGRTMTGAPCKRCIQLGCYCHQHKTQDPAFRGRQPTSSTAPGYGSSSDQYGTRHFGINKSNGQPCKVCINQRGFCHHHKDQDPQIFCHRAQPSLGRSKASPQQQQYAPYGRRQDGQPCKLCEKKQGFCHFHINQRC
jgi:DnaJ domain